MVQAVPARTARKMVAIKRERRALVFISPSFFQGGGRGVVVLNLTTPSPSLRKEGS